MDVRRRDLKAGISLHLEIMFRSPVSVRVIFPCTFDLCTLPLCDASFRSRDWICAVYQRKEIQNVSKLIDRSENMARLCRGGVNNGSARKARLLCVPRLVFHSENIMSRGNQDYTIVTTTQLQQRVANIINLDPRSKTVLFHFFSTLYPV